MKKISVIIPAYNTPQGLLEQCISSIQQGIENMKDVEILLLNDGSTDSHVERSLKNVAETDNRFRYIYKPNSGVSDTRNLGIQMAQGEYITFVDSDDYIIPNALSHMMEVIDNVHPEIGVFGISDERQKTKDVKPIYRELISEKKYDVILALCSGDQDFFWERNIFWDSPVAKLYNIHFIRDNKIAFIPQLVIGEDSVFNLQCLSVAKKIYVDNVITYCYVINQQSATNIISPARLKNIPHFMQCVEESVNDKLLEKNIYHSISRRLLRELRCARQFYLTHPDNKESFRNLCSELNSVLSTPVVKKFIRELRLSDAHDKIELKNIILLKLHLYWIYLITERRKRSLELSKKKENDVF